MNSDPQKKQRGATPVGIANDENDGAADLDPRLRSIVRALARQAAKEHYAQSCFEAERDSDSEG